MARTYKRDSKGRFAGGGGGGSARGKGSAKPAQAAKTTPKTKAGRGVEARLERSSMTMLGQRRRQTGGSGMTPEKNRHIARRVQQQKQAIAKWYSKLTPSQRKKADAKMQSSRIMNG